MGRPRKTATEGGNVTSGSLNSPMASTAIVKSVSLRRSGRLKTRSLLMIEEGNGNLQKPMPQKEILPNPEPNKEILSNLEPNKEVLPNPVPNNESLSNLVLNNESLSNPVLNNESLSNPVLNNESLSNLVLNNESLSNPVLNNESLSNPVLNNESLSNPVLNNESLSNPVDNNENTVEETDKAPNEQEKNSPEMLFTASIESKIDFLVESVKEFKREGVKRASPDETTPAQEVTYKSMYFESQRKIQELEEEIRELSKDYEVSQAKVEMLQQINVSLQNLNNISLVSNFGKATEAIVSLAAQGKLNVPAEEATAPEPAQAQIVAADQNPPARRSTKRTR